MSEVRFVFDTNTLVSAALMADSAPRKAFETAITRGTILMSAAMQDELSEVLRRQKFDKYIAEEKRLRFLVGLLQLATPVPITEQITACRDPKDNKVLDLP